MKGGNYMIKKFGFTLAEVLITLGIIGVVAAMTIPTLMQKTNDAELKSGYKKMISVISQAISMNYALDGVDFSEITTGGTTDPAAATNWLGFLYHRLNVVGSDESNRKVFFSDGSWLQYPATGNCTKASPCEVVIDVNGNKGPNQRADESPRSADQITNNTATIKDQYVVYAYDRQFSPTDDTADVGNFILQN